MEWFKQNQQKFLLGQLLINKNLISEKQLSEAIECQKQTGQRLGDIFAEWNIISQRQIQHILRTQRNLRLTASIITSLLAPIQAYAATATVPVTITQNSSQIAASSPASWRTLTEEELSEISGQGILDDTLVDWINAKAISSNLIHIQNIANSPINPRQQKTSGLEVLGSLASLMNPMLLLLEAKTTIKDIVYDTENTGLLVNKDGSVTLHMPSSIGLIKFENIRIKGSTGPSLGSIELKGIDLRGTTVSLTAH